MEEEQQAGQESAKELGGAMKKMGEAIKRMLIAFARALKVAFKYVAKFIRWLFSIICSNVYVLVIVIVIIAVIAIVIIVWGLIQSAGYDPNKGIMSSVGGVTGTHFYGERFMYYDDEYSNANLADTYLEFTYNILSDVNSKTTISLDFTAPYNTSSQINAITLSFANALSGTAGASVVENTSIIDHYGFTEAEGNTVLSNMATYLVNNGYTSASSSSLLSQLKTSYDANFAYMKNVCKKILIKDYILEAGKTAQNIERKNYFGFVYMPKQLVTLQEASFVFAVDDEKSVDIKLMYTNGTDETVLEEATADSSWYVNDVMEKALATTKTNDYLLNQFTAIDTANLNYLAEAKTLFQILRDNKFSIYFKDTAGDYSEEALLKNVNSGNYLYMTLTADSAYNMAEAFVTVKSY